jgi:HEAT repeat protein
VSASKEKGVVIRAGGYAEFASAVKTMMEALAEKDTFARNCAVVSLEEMANPECVDRLLELRKTEKDAEIEKDILRALGPCNGGRADVKEALLKELKSTSESMRMAAALSLGSLASDPDVQAALKKAYAGESSNKVKTAILFGITNSKDPANVDLIDALAKDREERDVEVRGRWRAQHARRRRTRRGRRQRRRGARRARRRTARRAARAE